MANCVMCGCSVPDGQRTCSMCYGDPEYGSDGYYRDFLRQQEEQEQRIREYERQYEEEGQ